MTALFQRGTYRYNGGMVSNFKIECDALGSEDWTTVAMLIADRVDPFGAVEGVPTGGIRLAEALRPYVTAGPLLIVDDVLTTGGSMERHRKGRDAMGAVLFSHGVAPGWVTSLFVLSHTATTWHPYSDHYESIRMKNSEQ